MKDQTQNNLFDINSENYLQACEKESAYWGQEIQQAVDSGIPFSADMRRAEKIHVDRGDGLPQQQIYDPVSERIMNGDLYDFVFHTVNQYPASRILVPTCGPGGLCLELARNGHLVHGIDISKGAIDIAKKFAEENPYKDNFGSLNYSVADLNKIELDENSYDMVIAWDGLHHILLLERFMQQINKALKPDGLFIFSDNVGMHWSGRMLGGGIYFILPTFMSYCKKAKYAFSGAQKIHQEMADRSPFEEIHTSTIIETANNLFDFKSITYHTGIGYRAAIAGDVKLPGFLKYAFLKCLKNFDKLAVKLKLLKGDHALVVASPKK